MKYFIFYCQRIEMYKFRNIAFSYQFTRYLILETQIEINRKFYFGRYLEQRERERERERKKERKSNNIVNHLNDFSLCSTE